MPAKKLEKTIPIFPAFAPMRVKYKDIFDLGALYEALHEWFQEYGWQDETDKLDHWENYYGERISQNGAKEIWFRWRMTKPATQLHTKLTYYFDLSAHCLGISSTEIVREGQKMKVDKGEIEFTIQTYIKQDYLIEFAKHLILKNFGDWFAKRMYHKTMIQRKKELYQEAYEFQNFLKQWFKLKRYLPYEETKGFFPSQAWPSHLK